MWTPPGYGPPPDLSFLVGQMMEQQANAARRLDTHERALMAADRRMDNLAERLVSLETTARATARPPGVPRWEVIVKAALPYLIGLATLAITGSLESAIKILLAVLKGG